MRRIAIGSSLVCLFFTLLATAPSCGGNTITPPGSTGTGGSNAGTGGSGYGPGTGGQGGNAGMVSTGGAPGQGGNAGNMATGGAAGLEDGGPSASICMVNDECSWGEIPIEILKPSDCMCLYGCPYIPQNKATLMRRNQQYRMFCNPRIDGNGHLCGIDDCIALPQAACVDGMCARAPTDGGMR